MYLGRGNTMKLKMLFSTMVLGCLALISVNVSGAELNPETISENTEEVLLETETEVDANVDPCEPNDSKGQATSLSFGTPVSGELGSYERYKLQGDDEDWFKFEGKAGELYRITLDDFCGEFADTTMCMGVFDPTDDVYYINFSMEYDGVNYYDYYAEYTGTYYICIDNYTDFSKEEHPYTLQIDKRGIGDKYSTYQGCYFTIDGNDDVRCYRESDGSPVINEFKCDGIYTYYFQVNGTAMRDRLTYHPDGVHVIYFDEYGHEVFSDFAHVKRNIQGNPVDDYCFFNVYGYMYVDVLTYNQKGDALYYANAYGVLERNGWFQFSDKVMWADGKPAEGVAGGYGYAYSDGELRTNSYAYDFMGRDCYLQANGVAKY